MNAILTCKYDSCKKYLIDPVLLPCLKNVCKSHLDVIEQQDSSRFKCIACNDEHDMPNNGFVVNPSLNEIINLDMHLSEHEKQAMGLVKKLKENALDFEMTVNDPEKFIYEYVSEIRNRIDLKREKLIDEINLISNEMLNKVNKFEYECNKNLINFNHLNAQYKEHLANLKIHIETWKEELRTPAIEQTRLNQLIETTTKAIKNVDDESLKYRNNMLMKKVCIFTESERKFDRLLFGEFILDERVNLMSIDALITRGLVSSILTSAQSLDLIKLCEFDSTAHFKLLYRATLDGFSAESFHKKCDGTSQTLTIVKVKDCSNIFGGYCSLPWDSSGSRKYDDAAFIFSLINQEKSPIKINFNKNYKNKNLPNSGRFGPNQANYSFCCYSNAGPTFGFSNKAFGLQGMRYNDVEHDFTIASDSNANYLSYSNLGVSYLSDNYTKGSNQARNLLAGSYNFKTDEIEVFQVAFS